MKTQDFILLGVVGAVGYFLYKSEFASGYSIVPRQTFEVSGITPSGETQSALFNTTQGGVEAMNEITSKGGKLNRTSKTLKVLGKNDTIAKLGDGSIKRITINTPSMDNSGKTKLDKIIAKNTKAKAVKK